MKNVIKGLSREEVERSIKLHGDNSLEGEKRVGFLKRFFENLSDPIIRILLVALVLQILFSLGDVNWLEIGGIGFAILLSTLVSTVSEFKSERAFDSMRADSEASLATVLRDGVIRQIPVSELVVGDTVYLSSGEKIPADGVVIEGKLTVDQSALNGESAETLKTAGADTAWNLSSKHKVFRGSIITDGGGIMRVGRVGGSTYYGMVAKDVQSETRTSPLKLRLGKLASQISKIGYVIAAIVGITFIFNSVFIDNSFDAERIKLFLSDYKNIVSLLLEALTLMITVVVVSAPEGLPMMITVVLSANMKKMLKDNVLVKKLVGIETAGSMNLLYTDKTGTLTEGQPTVEKIITYENSFKGVRAIREQRAVLRALTECARYNTDVVEGEDGLSGGNATDRAIYSTFREETVEALKIISKDSFSSTKKRSSVTLSSGKTYLKGAPEIIIAMSKYAISDRGERLILNPSRIMKEYYDSAVRGERVIAVAYYEGGREDETVFVALLVMKDKIRRGVREEVARVKGAGIQTVMLTGDGRETAIAIAEECGIYNPHLGHIALTHDELEKMTDREVKGVIPRLRVLSRALPQDKTRLVRLSQQMNYVVGMTGDGINDAPSLKLSDVGFSMGSGTDIAKSSSDVVILDNSFKAISKTVLYGRTIFKSIRKFITFQLIMNLAACGVSLIGHLIGVDTPITIIQMLWINIIMDTLGGLAFAGEAPLDYYMKEKPKSREEAILTREMLTNIVISGGFTLVLCLIFLTSPNIKSFYGASYPTEKFYTAFYALFIFSGLFNCFLARCERLNMLSNITLNRPFVFIMLFIAGVQCMMIYYGGAIFRCTPLTFKEISFVIMMSLSVIPFELLRRIVQRLI